MTSVFEVHNQFGCHTPTQGDAVFDITHNIYQLFAVTIFTTKMLLTFQVSRLNSQAARNSCLFCTNKCDTLNRTFCVLLKVSKCSDVYRLFPQTTASINKLTVCPLAVR